jgi:serine phosphatase RsbU (regulator of sigma subunit)
LRDAAVRENCPSDVLRAVNMELLRSAEGDFVTGVFATVDVTGAQPDICLAVAGHPLPLLRTPDGVVAPVGRNGTLLGAFAKTRAHDVRVELFPGHTLLLYTDGATEAVTTEGRFGEGRLARALGHSTAEDPQQIVEDIESAIVAARLPGAADDLALLAVRSA